jgi:hypothetical protein
MMGFERYVENDLGMRWVHSFDSKRLIFNFKFDYVMRIYYARLPSHGFPIPRVTL